MSGLLEACGGKNPEAQEAGLQLQWQWDPSQPLEKQWKIAAPESAVTSNERQVYKDRPQNVRVENKLLVLEAHKEGEVLTSGCVSTKDILNIEVGSRIEASIRMPKGRETLPAFWLLSRNQPYTSSLNPVDDGWSRGRFQLHSGRIIIAGPTDTIPGVMAATASTLHTDYTQVIPSSGTEGVFHTYALDWLEDQLIWRIDGKPFYTLDGQPPGTPEAWPFTAGNDFYAILSLAMSGDANDRVTEDPGAWRMEIASVKYYK